MKKILLVMSLATVLAVLLPFSIKDTTLNILYALSGVLFSVGMSLIIAFNTFGVRNEKIKNGLRHEIHMIRNKYSVVFIICSILYIVYSFIGEKNQSYDLLIKEQTITLNFSIGVMANLLYSISFYIIGFIQIQNFYESLEDIISKEMKR